MDSQKKGAKKEPKTDCLLKQPVFGKRTPTLYASPQKKASK